MAIFTPNIKVLVLRTAFTNAKDAAANLNCSKTIVFAPVAAIGLSIARNAERALLYLTIKKSTEAPTLPFFFIVSSVRTALNTNSLFRRATKPIKMIMFFSNVQYDNATAYWTFEHPDKKTRTYCAYDARKALLMLYTTPSSNRLSMVSIFDTRAITADAMRYPSPPRASAVRMSVTVVRLNFSMPHIL